MTGNPNTVRIVGNKRNNQMIAHMTITIRATSLKGCNAGIFCTIKYKR